MKISYATYGRWLFRIGIATVFLYFGFQALKDPVGQAHLWTRREILELISGVAPLEIAFTVFGIAELFVAFTLLTGVLARWGLFLAAALLVGIIVNLGFNDISVRDFTILTGVLYLLAQEQGVSDGEQAARIK